jgi:hypothetical protein
VNLSFLSQLLDLGLGLNVNTSLSAPKLRSRPQIGMRLWTNGKLQMMIDLWKKKHWEYGRQPMATKNWEELVKKIKATFSSEVSCI